jgi:PAS domain S-box-containing protein
MKKRLSKADAPTQVTDAETLLDVNDFIVSKTDLKGVITYCNRIFVDMCGYPIKDLMGANHNVIRHPDMPRIAYKLLWEKAQRGEEFFGIVKNLRADGGFYWVFAYIVPDRDTHGNIIGYTSFRRRASRSAIEAVIPLYQELVEVEQEHGLKASRKFLNNYLTQKHTSYDDLIINLQREQS